MTLIHEPDRGTPAVSADTEATVHIDGRAVTVPSGTSVMRAAALAGIEIPKLCATDSLKAFGGRGRQGHPSVLHDPLCRRHGRLYPD